MWGDRSDLLWWDSRLCYLSFLNFCACNGELGTRWIGQRLERQKKEDHRCRQAHWALSDLTPLQLYPVRCISHLSIFVDKCTLARPHIGCFGSIWRSRTEDGETNFSFCPSPSSNWAQVEPLSSSLAWPQWWGNPRRQEVPAWDSQVSWKTHDLNFTLWITGLTFWCAVTPKTKRGQI